MNFDTWLPGLIVLTSLLPGVLIFFLREESHRLRSALNLTGALTKFVLVGVMIWGVFHAHVYESHESRWSLAPGLDLVLHADALSVLFVTLSTVLWLVTTVYAIVYLEASPHRSRQSHPGEWASRERELVWFVADGDRLRINPASGATLPSAFEYSYHAVNDTQFRANLLVVFDCHDHHDASFSRHPARVGVQWFAYCTGCCSHPVRVALPSSKARRDGRSDSPWRHPSSHAQRRTARAQ